MDERLRELAREAASGDVEARARWLAERLRLGAVPASGLELAAVLGDDGARMALELPAVPEQDFEEWLSLTVGHGPDVALLAACTAGDFALRAVPIGAGTRERVETHLRVIGAWRECPCDSHAAAVVRLHDELDREAAPDEVMRLLTELARLIARRQQLTYRGVFEDSCGRAVRSALEALTTFDRSSDRHTAREQVRGAVREALVPWALGDAKS